MTLRRPCWMISVPLVLVSLLCFGGPAEACSVCFGDPDSPLTHGAKWGILTMVVLTYSLLVGMAAMLGFVMVRARRRHLATVRGEDEL